MAVRYGEGRIFNTVLGHAEEGGGPAMQSVGLLLLFSEVLNGKSGTVTQEVPYDFPTAAAPVLRPDYLPVTLDVAFEQIVSYDISKSTKYYTFIKSQIALAGGDEKALGY